jgi:hypothetical protein
LNISSFADVSNSILIVDFFTLVSGWLKSCKLDSEEFISMILPLRVSKFFPAVLKRAVLLGCGLLMLPAFGQQPLQTLLVGVDRRTVTSLDGDWHYLVDAPPAGALYRATARSTTTATR